MYVGYGYGHGMCMTGTNVTLMTFLGLFSGYLLFQIAVKVCLGPCSLSFILILSPFVLSLLAFLSSCF